MAAIPTVLYFGGLQINGGDSTSRAIAKASAGAGQGGLWGVYGHNARLARVIPSGADAITGATFNPYWDGNYLLSYTSTGATSTTITVATGTWQTNVLAGKTISITAGVGSGQTRTVASNTATTITVTVAWVTNPTASTFNLGAGAFVPFHYCHSYQAGVPDALGVGLVPGAYGDNWYEFGAAITPAALLCRALWDRYPTGFKLIKFAQSGGFQAGADQWKTTGSGYANALATVNNAKNALPAGDTLDVKVCIIDVGDHEILGWVSDPGLYNTYKATVTAFVAGIRASFGASTTKVVIVNHHIDQLATTTLNVGARLINNLNRELKTEIANFHVFDMNWATDFVPATLGVGIDPTDWRYYGGNIYLLAGAKLGAKVVRLLADAPDPVVGPLPCVVMLCDSQGVGPADAQYAFLSQQESLLGPVGGTVREDQWIWNEDEEEWQLYDVYANPNTWGTASSNVGPEATLLKRMKARFPNGVAVFKYARASVPLTIDADPTLALESQGPIWAEFEAQWALALRDALSNLGRPLECVGIVTDLGGNDTNTVAAANAFATKCSIFIDDIRTLFTTRSYGPELPVAWLQNPPHVDNGGNSEHGVAAPNLTVRGAIASLPSSRNRVAALLNAGGDQYELSRDDRIHYGAEATWQIGYDWADAIVELIDEDDEGETSSESAASESAAFTVEDGSGLTDANSYVSVADADDFHAEEGNPASWIAASVFEKQDALRRASRWVDRKCGAMWRGTIAHETQSMQWPRFGVRDGDDGRLYSSEALPQRLKDAVCAAALKVIDAVALTADVTAGEGGVASSSVTVGPISVSESFAGVRGEQPRFVDVERMLRGLTIASWGGMVKVSR